MGVTVVGNEDDEALVPEAQAVISGRTVSGVSPQAILPLLAINGHILRDCVCSIQAHFTPAMELESYLVETVGIKTGAGVYVERLIANGVDSEETFGALSAEELGAEPFLFKKGHLRQVEAFRGERPPSAPGMVVEGI